MFGSSGNFLGVFFFFRAMFGSSLETSRKFEGKCEKENRDEKKK